MSAASPLGTLFCAQGSGLGSPLGVGPILTHSCVRALVVRWESSQHVSDTNTYFIVVVIENSQFLRHGLGAFILILFISSTQQIFMVHFYMSYL